MLLHNIKRLYKWLFVRSQKLETEPVVENTIANLGCKTKEDLRLMTKDSLEAYRNSELAKGKKETEPQQPATTSY
jgi:hypothetical protein